LAGKGRTTKTEEETSEEEVKTPTNENTMFTLIGTGAETDVMVRLLKKDGNVCAVIMRPAGVAQLKKNGEPFYVPAASLPFTCSHEGFREMLEDWIKWLDAPDEVESKGGGIGGGDYDDDGMA
jgi:hypothetical protein